MFAFVRSSPAEIEKALKSLGLTPVPLLRAVMAGYLAWASSTENDPPFLPGSYQWGRTVRELRDQLLPEKWHRSNEGNYCVVIEPKGRFAIAVAAGCPNTGSVHGIPTTKRGKGPATAQAVQANAQYLQYDLFPKAPVIIPESQDRARATWVLLYHRGETEIRAELSLPQVIDDDGHISSWRERILLPAQPLDPEVSPVVPDFGPDLEIDIRRRA